MSEPRIVITGAQGGVANRLEINDLIKNTDQFSLYIQALIEMYETPQDDPLSYFAISGIHGAPYEQWGGTDPIPGGRGGYCTHGNVLFPTWHRAYVALYEQELQKHAIGIAEKYAKDKQRWLKAAQDLRAPYWDWAKNTVLPHEVICLQRVEIITPDGDTTTVPNPLYQYTFNPIHDSFPDRFKYWKTTIRQPTPPNGPTATTNVQALIRELSSAKDDITLRTYNLLTRVHTWPAFSNYRPGKDDDCSSSNSLEAIHDCIHGLFGGQMNNGATGGFDPCFYLHHANVDRILSLWAAVNPGVWVSESSSKEATFTIPSGSSLNTYTALTPFWNTETTHWPSSQLTATEKLNYSYPEFNGLDLGNQDAVKKKIGDYINEQYGGGGTGVFSFFQGRAPISLFAQPAAGGAQAPEHGTEGQIVLYDWTVRIHFKKYELGGSLAVLIFLGEVPDGPSQWRTAPTFVGSHHAFVNSLASQCDNCREQVDIVDEGFVHLDSAIAASKRSGLSSFDPSEVIPYLKENLHWRVQADDRTAVDLSRLPSLEVTVVSTPLTLPSSSIFPIPDGDPQYHHHITHGRLGGARQAQA